MTIVYPINQNPTLFLDATTLLEPPNIVELTHDILNPIFDPLGVQISNTYNVFMPQQNETIPFGAPRSDMGIIVRFKAVPDEGNGALIIAFGHPGVGNEDIVYIVPPTSENFWTFLVMSEESRDRIRIQNSSQSSYFIETLVIDCVRTQVPDPVDIASPSPIPVDIVSSIVLDVDIVAQALASLSIDIVAQTFSPLIVQDSGGGPSSNVTIDNWEGYRDMCLADYIAFGPVGNKVERQFRAR